MKYCNHCSNCDIQQVWTHSQNRERSCAIAFWAHSLGKKTWGTPSPPPAHFEGPGVESQTSAGVDTEWDSGSESKDHTKMRWIAPCQQRRSRGTAQRLGIVVVQVHPVCR